MLSRRSLLDKVIYLSFGLSGAAALIYEIVWTRGLSSIMGSTTYAMSTMLAAFMAGLSLGGIVGARLSERTRRPALVFALCELGIGLFGVLIVPVISHLTPVFISVYYAFHLSFQGLQAVEFLLSFLVMGIPTTLMGMTFPIVIRYMNPERGEAGAVTGRLYSINTLGAIGGSVGAGFLLIPILGVKMAALIAASLNIAGAMAVLIMSGNRRHAAMGAMASVLALALYAGASWQGIPLFSFYTAPRFDDREAASRVYDYVQEHSDELLRFRYEGPEGDVYVMDSLSPDAPSRYTLLSGGKLEGGDDTGFALLGYLPYFSMGLPEMPGGMPYRTRALNIGLGSGHTLEALERTPLDEIECVELSRGVIEANRLLLSPALFGNPRIRHIQADGRNHLMLAMRKYDVIVVSPSWAVETSSAGMLTDEFFGLAASKLTSHGVFAIWLDQFLERDEDLKIVERTLARSFPYVRVWNVSGTPGLVVTASKSAFAESPFGVMRQVGGTHPELVGRYMPVMEEGDVASLPRGAINTDDSPVIEFHNARNILSVPVHI